MNKLSPFMVKPTSAKPRMIDGVTFRCYHVGPLRYEWRSDDGNVTAWDNYNHLTYSGYVRRHRVGHRYRSLDAALRAALKAYLEQQ